ncbi:hypothetical protein BT96DRAFT_1001312 [Gymnopus androsaceus JB14]|uniref:Uncharacterized protein n=1 Tax=Gymnopus androsaceus JB14 TaxID=1447944 RepID=A0A6A4H252_9AGAR|nr:hypothetical protein BT96DRAFT_1001312 [Gymnopus androsaceus JB14]
MARGHTSSAIKKAKCSDAEQAEVIKGKRIGYSRWNQQKNKAQYNASNSARMSKKRVELDQIQNAEAQEWQRVAARKSYLKNHTNITQTANDKWMTFASPIFLLFIGLILLSGRAHMEKHGNNAIWWFKMHKGTRRVGTDSADGVEG